MKTNEVTRRFKRGSYGVEFESKNPVTFLFEDVKTGRLKPEVRKEKVLSAITEFLVTPGQLRPVLQAIKHIAPKIDSVSSLDLISFPEESEKEPALKAVKEMGFPVFPNGKENLGLGRILNR